MNKFIKIILKVLLLLLPFTAVASADRIDRIVIQGNYRVESSTILEYSHLKPGDIYSPTLHDKIIQNLYMTALFDDIRISFNSGILTLKVQEMPFVSKVVFEGNSKINSTKITAEILTLEGDTLRQANLKTDIEKIKEMYKRLGRFSTSVTTKIVPQSNNRVKVIFQIKEGPKTGIHNISFVGNDNYSDSELKSIILTKESRWFSFLETNDTYDPDRIEYDKYLLKQFYNSVGFADFRVISVTAELLPTKEGFTLIYSIEEGEKYRLGDIKLANRLKSIPNSEIEPFIIHNKGKVFNYTMLETMAEKISSYLASQGYPQVDVHPELNPDMATKIVDVTIVVDRADKIFINQINIEGNLKTEEHVIRRQFKIAEGDLFNRAKIEKGEQNLRNLDYFEKLIVRVNPANRSDRYNIDINVEEKSTSSISFDLGYNTAGGPFGRLSFLERNLVGTGRYLNAGIQVGKKNISYYGGVTDPNFLDKDLSLSTNFFKNQNGRGSGFNNGDQDYASDSIGLRNSLGYDITDDLFHEIEYSIKQDRLSGPKSTSSIFIIEQMGKFITSAIGHSLTYDRTDSSILPKNGYILVGSQEFAGLGGNTEYLKHEAESKFYVSFYENKYTLKLSASSGVIHGVGGKRVRISERFNLGDYSLRGFSYGGVGPRDKITKEGLRGQKFYTISSELSFPLGLPKEFNVTGSVFADAGSLWDVDSNKINPLGFYNDKSMRVSVGFGVLWITKIMPIRMDWAYPIKKEKYDERQSFHIKFTTHI